MADSRQSKLVWTGHAEVGNYAPTGTIDLRHGTIMLRNGRIYQGRIEIDVRTIRHENEQMQTHLRGADFFDTTTFPTASFTVQQARNGLIEGKLTLKGITKPISFPVTLTRIGNDIHLKGQLSIDRTAFGIKYNSTSFFAGLGDHAIHNTFEVAFDVVVQPDNTANEQSARVTFRKSILH